MELFLSAIGEQRLTLLEILGAEDSSFEIGEKIYIGKDGRTKVCLLYTSPSPRDS